MDISEYRKKRKKLTNLGEGCDFPIDVNHNVNEDVNDTDVVLNYDVLRSSPGLGPKERPKRNIRAPQHVVAVVDIATGEEL